LEAEEDRGYGRLVLEDEEELVLSEVRVGERYPANEME